MKPLSSAAIIISLLCRLIGGETKYRTGMFALSDGDHAAAGLATLAMTLHVGEAGVRGRRCSFRVTSTHVFA